MRDCCKGADEKVPTKRCRRGLKGADGGSKVPTFLKRCRRTTSWQIVEQIVDADVFEKVPTGSQRCQRGLKGAIWTVVKLLVTSGSGF